MRIFITDISSYKSIVFCRALSGARDITVISGDHRKLTRYCHTRWTAKHRLYPRPSSNPEGFVKTIVDIVRDERIDMLVPINSVEIRLCLQQRSRLGRTLAYLGTEEAFHTLDDKKALYAMATDLQIPTPRTDVLGAIAQAYPVVIKPVTGAGAAGVKYADSEAAYRTMAGELSDVAGRYVVQPFIRGVGVGYSVLCERGRIVCGYGHRRIAENPITGGSSTVRMPYDHPDMRRIAEAIIEKTRWSGLAMFEFKLLSDNSVTLLEVNPRVWGSINQAIANGCNFPLLLCRMHQNGTATPIPTEPAGTTMTHLAPLSYLNLLQYLVLRGDPKPLAFFLKHYPHASVDVSIADDPRGFFSLFFKLMQR